MVCGFGQSPSIFGFSDRELELVSALDPVAVFEIIRFLVSRFLWGFGTEVFIVFFRIVKCYCWNQFRL